MAGPVHDSLIRYLVHYKEDMQSTHPLTLSEQRSIDFYTSTSAPLPHQPFQIDNYRPQKAHYGGLQIAIRRPNTTINTITTAICPRIVFEVAFTRSYDSVCEDACQWLVRSNGWVKLCIIIKTYEEPYDCTNAQVTSEIVDQDGTTSADGASSSNCAGSR